MSALTGAMWNKSEDLHVEVTIEEPIITVEFYDKNWTKLASGHAKCDPADTFSIDFGLALAQVRATERLSGKLKRALIRSKK